MYEPVEKIWSVASWKLEVEGENVLIKIDAAVGEFTEGSLLLKLCSRCTGQHSLFLYS